MYTHIYSTHTRTHTQILRCPQPSLFASMFVSTYHGLHLQHNSLSKSLKSCLHSSLCLSVYFPGTICVFFIIYMYVCICMYGLHTCICMYISALQLIKVAKILPSLKLVPVSLLSRYHLCVFIYIYICMYVCICICIYIHIYVCIYVCMYICMYACIHAYSNNKNQLVPDSLLSIYNV